MEAEGNRPTAADYAWAAAQSAGRDMLEASTLLREQQKRLDLAEEKLKCISYIERSLYEDIGLVNSGELSRELRSILEASTLEDLRKLCES